MSIAEETAGSNVYIGVTHLRRLWAASARAHTHTHHFYLAHERTLDANSKVSQVDQVCSRNAHTSHGGRPREWPEQRLARLVSAGHTAGHSPQTCTARAGNCPRLIFGRIRHVDRPTSTDVGRTWSGAHHNRPENDRNQCGRTRIKLELWPAPCRIPRAVHVCEPDRPEVGQGGSRRKPGWMTETPVAMPRPYGVCMIGKDMRSIP